MQSRHSLDQEQFNDVLSRAKMRDRDALDILCEHYLHDISVYIAAHAPPYAVNDLTSDVFVKMVESIENVRANDEGTFRAWIFQIARNTVTDYHRRRRLTEPLSLELQKQLRASDDPLRALTDQETIEDLTEELSKLTEEQRQVLDGRFMQGLSFDVIAAQMGKQAGTVRALQHRAIQSLRRNLGRIIVILFLLGSLLGIGYALIRTATPGSPLYPVKQWSKQLRHSLEKPEPKPARVTPTHVGQATPTAAMKSADDLEDTGKQGSSTSAPVPTATSTPVPILDVNAPLLSTATTRACLLKTCLNASLP